VSILAFILSNIDGIIAFFIVIYYIVNPCLLSWPLLAFTFLYHLITPYKINYVLAIYIFLLILTAEVLKLVENYDASFEKSSVYILKYFFTTNADNSDVYYSVGYLYFLLIVVVVGEEVARHRGSLIGSGQKKNEENFTQALLRLLMNEPEKSRMYLWKYA
jgi:glucan phosphoethanolaminetransferase (alkaline phosphatase superfamily)